MLAQVTKYGQRGGWSARDLLRLAHPRADFIRAQAARQRAEQAAGDADSRSVRATPQGTCSPACDANQHSPMHLLSHTGASAGKQQTALLPVLGELEQPQLWVRRSAAGAGELQKASLDDDDNEDWQVVDGEGVSQGGAAPSTDAGADLDKRVSIPLPTPTPFMPHDCNILTA